jgi:hypothetical protein
MDEIWRLPSQNRALPEGLGYQINLEIRQIPETSVDQAGGFGCHAGSKVSFFEEQTRKPAKRRVPCSACPGYASADDDKVEKVIMLEIIVPGHPCPPLPL